MRCASMLLAALGALTAFADVDQRLRYPSWFCDPSATPPPVLSSNVNEIATFWLPEETDAFTVMVWQRSNVGPTGTRFILAYYTAEAARSTQEGGPELPGIREFAPVSLSAGGTWSMSGLPSEYEQPENFGYKWQYGCFCVNVLTQTPLTMTVAGAEKQIPASASKQVFNILGEADDRSVTISAADPSAPVDFGIAVNPLIQFMGQDIGDTDVFSGDWDGINVSNRCTFIVLRCKIDAGHTTSTWCGECRQTDGHSLIETRAEPLWKERARFAKNARATFSWCTWGVNPGYDYRCCEVYGKKMAMRWLSDAEIDRIYDADLEVIRARHYMGE